LLSPRATATGAVRARQEGPALATSRPCDAGDGPLRCCARISPALHGLARPGLLHECIVAPRKLNM
jgi:hypothetical protein